MKFFSKRKICLFFFHPSDLRPPFASLSAVPASTAAETLASRRCLGNLDSNRSNKLSSGSEADWPWWGVAASSAWSLSSVTQSGSPLACNPCHLLLLHSSSSGRVKKKKKKFLILEEKYMKVGSASHLTRPQRAVRHWRPDASFLCFSFTSKCFGFLRRHTSPEEVNTSEN